jgi:uncharacterized protein YdaU (DUF1376 family)
VSARWYKRCGADFIHGTMMLSLEEKGAYSLCLDLIYDRGGPIPDDARWLSGVCGVSIRKWNAIRERLVTLGKISAENGLLSNSRAALELVSAELSSRKLAEAGAKGGRKRAENQFDYNVISHLAQATLKLYREDKRREEEKDSASNDADGQVGEEILLPEHVIDEWNRVAKRLAFPRVRDLTPERRQLVRARIAQYSIDDFTDVFGKVERSPFLRGDTGGWRGARFDWIIKKGNFQKVLEGNYDQ